MRHRRPDFDPRGRKGTLGLDSEIGRILHLKSEIRNRKLDRSIYDCPISGFKMQDSSDFTIFRSLYALNVLTQFLEERFEV